MESMKRNMTPAAILAQAISAVEAEGVRLREESGNLGHLPFGVAAKPRHGVGGFTRGVLCVLAAFERVVEGQPVITFGHGLTRA